MATTKESGSGNRYQILCYEQIQRLTRVMTENIQAHGKGNFPTLDIQLKELVKEVKLRLTSKCIDISDVRLNGGAASYILGLESPNQTYNDLDLIFRVDLERNEDIQAVKSAVFDSLLRFLPDDVSREKMNSEKMQDAYVHKLVKVSNDKDRWSLISLSNHSGRNIELKFVYKMKRQFEFSVDSFQILLDSLLTFYSISEKALTEHFYPTVVAESMYGDFGVALHHLNKKLIATRCPEQIRGGGLLKYCNLLAHGYTPADDMNIKALERYMCSRFFIDFPDIEQQHVKLWNYQMNHFIGEDHLKFDFLMRLFCVISESTVCLMGHERRQTLSLIQHLAIQVRSEQETRAYKKYLAIAKFDNENFGSSMNRSSPDPKVHRGAPNNLDRIYYNNNNIVYSQAPPTSHPPPMTQWSYAPAGFYFPSNQYYVDSCANNGGFAEGAMYPPSPGSTCSTCGTIMPFS